MAKVTAIAGKSEFWRIFGPNPAKNGRIWADLGVAKRRQGDKIIFGLGQVLTDLVIRLHIRRL